MKQKFLIIFLCAILIILLYILMMVLSSAYSKDSSVMNKTNSVIEIEKNRVSLDKHLGDWTLPNMDNDTGDYHISVSKENDIYQVCLDMSTLHKELFGKAVLAVNEQAQTANSVETFGYDGFNDNEDVFLDIDIKWDEQSLWIKGFLVTSDGKIFDSGNKYQECTKGWISESYELEEYIPEEYINEAHRTYWDDNWPSNANDSWKRFYSYGGTFFVNEYNNWICNVGGYAIVWEGNKWTYTSKSGDYFIQYNGSDYFHIDTSDMYYSLNMKSLTGWVKVTSSGVISCEEPQIFRDDVEKLKQSVYELNFNSKVEAFRNMGFDCYQENGVWKCDTQSGILTYFTETQEWHGVVDIYNYATDSWEYGVSIMVGDTCPLGGNQLFRYADGRYDKGKGVYDSDTDLSGRTYNIQNFGIKGTKIYNENSKYLDVMEMSDFVGFWIFESQYEVDTHPPKQ